MRRISALRVRFFTLLIAAIWLTACTEKPPFILEPTLLPTVLPRPTVAPLSQPEAAATGNGQTQATAAEPTGTATPSRPPAAVAFPDPDQYEWRLVASGFTLPVDLASPEDGSGRLLIVEQGGLIRIIENGVISETIFLDISDRIKAEGSEQGLLGIAFDPGYKDNKFFYVNYTNKRGDSVIARFKLREDSLTADPASEQILLQVNQPYANHNGGGLAFGPDGYLYIGLGDGGSAGDPQGRAQNPDTLLGKMLRIDVSGQEAYTIPADNPFSAGGGRQEIWATGLRNPWRYSFDRITGDLYIADVGQNKYEEVNYLPAGSPAGGNLGWDYFEGDHPFEGKPDGEISFINPAAVYDHNQGCSITGGYVYRGTDLPEFEGIYLYGDYCNGSVWGLIQQNDIWKNQLLFQINANISSFGQDSRGEIYILDHRTGSVYILVHK